MLDRYCISQLAANGVEMWRLYLGNIGTPFDVWTAQFVGRNKSVESAVQAAFMKKRGNGISVLESCGGIF